MRPAGRPLAALVALALAAPTARADAPAPTTREVDASTAQDVAAPTASEVVLLLPLEIDGEVEEHVAGSLELRLVEGLRRGNFTVVDGAALRDRLAAGACEGACLRDLAAEAGATHLVRARVTVEGRDYNVQVELVSAARGEIAATSKEFCEICGYEELGERVGDLAAALRRKLSAHLEPPPRLRVEVEPAGSVVTVDGEIVGVTPLDVEVAAGERDVVVHRDGYIARRQRIAFVDGVTETITAALAEVPRPTDEVEAPRARRLAPLGWLSIALGVGATASGVALVAIDERPIRSDCEGANVDAEGDCRWRYNTFAGGVTMTAAGVAAVAIGAALVAIDRRRGRRAKLEVAASGAGLGVRF